MALQGNRSTLVKFTLLNRDRADYFVDRYSERKAEGRRTVEHN